MTVCCAAQGFTPLHLASMYGHGEVVSTLLERVPQESITMQDYVSVDVLVVCEPMGSCWA